VLDWLEKHEERDHDRWDSIEDKQDRILEILEGTGEDHAPGLKIKVDRLEQTQALQGRFLRWIASILGTSVAGALAWIADHFLKAFR
jgi:hypothetical protein